MYLMRIALVGLLWVSSHDWVWAKKPQDLSVRGTFARMEIALKQKNEVLFAKQWHPQGYAVNLVGGSGVPGRGVYRQGSRKRWYLKPDFGSTRKLSPRVRIITCAIWSWQKKRPVDRVHAVVVAKKMGWWVLGAGERLKQVQALALRYIKKQPLPPKKK